MEIVSLLIKILLCIISLFLIIVVLIQDNEQIKTVGGGGISKKTRGKTAMYNKLTKIAAISFMVMSVALLFIQRFA